MHTGWEVLTRHSNPGNELEDEDGIFIIEWGERLKEFFKNEVISVYFEHVDRIPQKIINLCKKGCTRANWEVLGNCQENRIRNRIRRVQIKLM